MKPDALNIRRVSNQRKLEISRRVVDSQTGKGEELKCQEEGCDGTIDRRIALNLRDMAIKDELASLGHDYDVAVFPCNKCGRLYRADDGSPVFNKDGAKAFLKRDSII